MCFLFVLQTTDLFPPYVGWLVPRAQFAMEPVEPESSFMPLCATAGSLVADVLDWRRFRALLAMREANVDLPPTPLSTALRLLHHLNLRSAVAINALEVLDRAERSRGPPCPGVPERT